MKSTSLVSPTPKSYKHRIIINKGNINDKGETNIELNTRICAQKF